MTTHQRRGALRHAHAACARLLAAAVLVSVSQASLAQNVMVYSEGQTPSAHDVADILSRGASENIKQRGLNISGSPFAVLEQKPVNSVREASALSVPVQFGFDSAELTPQTRQQLNAIAEGIKLTDGTVKVVIEGHTDAKGRAVYNDKLSLRRATAVRDYFVQERQLPVKLLTVEGKGAQKLLDKADPFSPRNRRVQFRAG
jgi:outer membrane protein OmpA-like peptidoglycan-associated protein